VQCPHDKHALIDMGNFVCDTLKDLRTRPVARLTIAGGFAKHAPGDLDLHSARSRIDTAALDRLAGDHPFATAEMVS
jgi:cobalt-precorrin-5B (C1)-methyltransferase